MVDGQPAQQHRVKKHEKAEAVALLHRLQVVGEQAHQSAHLVFLVELAGQVLGVVEHLVAQVGLHLDGRAENAHPPQKAAEYHGDDNPHHGQADAVQQEVHVKGDCRAVHDDIALVHAVDDLLVQVGDDELDIVHQDQGGQPEKKPPSVLNIISVDVFSEDHADFLTFRGWAQRPPPERSGPALRPGRRRIGQCESRPPGHG